MRSFVSKVGILAVLWASAAIVAAQAKPSVEELDRIMKKDGPAQQALVKALVSGDKAGARTHLATLKTGITEGQKFWSANKRTDALDITKTVLAKIDALDKMIGAPNFESATALTAVQDLNRSCTDCHRIYRTTDDDGHYMLKPGSVPGY
jgi:hypothetical protein